MATIKVQASQTILDMALMESGSIESAFSIAARLNINITDEVMIGVDEIFILDKPVNRVLRVYQENSIIPATNLELNLMYEGVGYWYIQSDFIVQ